MRTVSTKAIIAKVFRDLHLKDTSRWIDFAEWCGEAVGFIGAFNQFINKEKFGLTISNYRYLLPCDLHAIIQINYQGSAIQYLGGSFDMGFHDPDSKNLKTSSRFGYRINGAYIIFNFTSADFDLSYQAFDTDDDGFPNIPDTSSYKEAVTSYIIKKFHYPLWVSGRIDNTRYEKMDRDWQWYCGQAAAGLMMPSADEMAAISRQWNRLIPETNREVDFFNELGNPDRMAGS